MNLRTVCYISLVEQLMDLGHVEYKVDNIIAYESHHVMFQDINASLHCFFLNFFSSA